MGADQSRFRIVPELSVASLPEAVAELARFGFRARDTAGTRLERGDQVIELVLAGPGPQGRHGVIDHLALKTQDVDAAGRAVLELGGFVDPSVTPDGPLEIAEFWGLGVRYQFFRGPGGARLELCALRGGHAAVGAGLADLIQGHDHVGIACRDIAASVGFYQRLGLELVHAVDLERPAGRTEVRFLRRGGQTVELYSAPERRSGLLTLPGQGLWRGLRFEGLGRQGQLSGPDGEQVTLV